MSARRLLILGASGLVGGELYRRAAERGYAVLGAARNLAGDATVVVDLTQPAQVERVLADARPDVVALCSAWPYVDGCEQDPARSHRENVETAQNVVRATAGTKVKLLGLSSDHVFDGRKDRYVESDAPHPLSVYARHKRELETLLLERGDSLVARTAWVFGRELRRKNFMYRVIDTARAGQPLKVPEGQAGCPTWSRWLAESCLTLLEQGAEGVVHLTGEKALTKAQWARLLVRELGLPALEITETSAKDAGQVAPRPDRVALASERHTLVQPPLETLLRQERERFLAST